MKTSFRVNFTFSSKGVKNFIKSVQSGFMLVRTASISTVNEKKKKKTQEKSTRKMDVRRLMSLIL